MEIFNLVYDVFDVHAPLGLTANIAAMLACSVKIESSTVMLKLWIFAISIIKPFPF